MKKIIPVLIVLIFLTSCSSPKSTAKGNTSASTAQSSKAASNESTTEKDTNVKSLTNLISMDKEMVGDYSYSSITIIPLESISDQKYIAKIRKGGNWEEHFWNITYDGKNITAKEEIKGIIAQIMKYDLIQISQGEYLQLYIYNNRGIGSTVLLNLKTMEVDYTFEGTIDRYQEGYVSDSIVKQFNLPAIKVKESNYGYSFVYYGDCLTSYYSDINKDGKTDAVFYGYKELVSDDYDTYLGHSLPLHEYFIKSVYLFDSSKNEFVYNEKMSVDKLIN